MLLRLIISIFYLFFVWLHKTKSNCFVAFMPKSSRLVGSLALNTKDDGAVMLLWNFLTLFTRQIFEDEHQIWTRWIQGVSKQLIKAYFVMYFIKFPSVWWMIPGFVLLTWAEGNSPRICLCVAAMFFKCVSVSNAPLLLGSASLSFSLNGDLAFISSPLYFSPLLPPQCLVCVCLCWCQGSICILGTVM